MLPGRSYSIADILRMLRRWAWLIVPWPVIGVAVAWTVSQRIPDQYRSETLILVVPQRVPETYVRSTVTLRIEDRLKTMSQEILSRTRLEKVVRDFALYPELRRELALEEVIERMREDIALDIARDDSFKISYTYAEPRIAQRVTAQLATLFIEDNLRDREAQAEGTNQFLESQLGDARRRLVEQEKRLEEYRRQYSGQLPAQAPSNLQAIQTTQQQIQALTDAVNHDRQRELIVERMLSDIPPAAALNVPAGEGRTEPVAPAQQLELARQQLRALELRLTPLHPDLRRARRRVEELESKAAELAEGKQPAPIVAMNPAERARQSEITQLRAEHDALDRQVAQRLAEIDQLKKKVADYQARVEASPARESEMIELTRDYDTLLASYRGLLTKKEESQIATNLERRQIGEQFRVVDPARVPERPFSPNRPMILGVGVALGLVFGLGLVALIQLSDRTFRSEADVVEALMLPVLALIPAASSPAEVAAGRRQRWFIASAVGVVILAAGVGIVLWTLKA